MARIESPDKGFTGPGPGGLHFTDGAAETDDPAVISYCQGAGYTVNGERLNDVAANPRPVDQVDPRDVRPTLLGGALRDAATDPRPGDNAPYGAGTGNPHGPNVVADPAAARHLTAPAEQGGTGPVDEQPADADQVDADAAPADDRPADDKPATKRARR